MSEPVEEEKPPLRPQSSGTSWTPAYRYEVVLILGDLDPEDEDGRRIVPGDEILVDEDLGPTFAFERDDGTLKLEKRGLVLIPERKGE